jgi:hypothetical protein
MNFQLNQKCVLFNKSAEGLYPAHPTFGDGAEVDCRISRRQQQVLRGGTGEITIAAGNVLLGSATTISVGDRIYLGELDALDSSSYDPVHIAEEVIAIDQVYSVNGQISYKKAYVQ